jgi:ATP:cob(I)alamin adenosyltransferase
MGWDPEQKIYTKAGDRLTTSLPRNSRISKSDDRLQLLGTIDELTSALGIVRAESDCNDFKRFILRIQQNLMSIMGGTADGFMHTTLFPMHEVEILEKAIDKIENSYEHENHFVCPGDTLRGAHLDMARTIARRAERCMAECYQSGKLIFPDTVTSYVNRLSDYLYVAARLADMQGRQA